MEPDNETLDKAYELVPHSYQWALQRFEAINGRLQNALTILATVPVLVLLIRSEFGDPSLDSWCFIVAIGIFGLAVLLGICTLFWGNLALISSTVIYKKNHLSRTRPDFQKWALETASNAFSHNRKVILWKARIAFGVGGSLPIVLALLALWAISAA